jgi:hypothetical protein
MDKRLRLTSIVRRLADTGSFHLYATQEDLIVDPVVDTDRVCVANSIDLVAILGYDLGIAPCLVRIEGAIMLLKRSDEHESVLHTMRRETRNRSSKLRSERFTAEDFATCFGLSERDIEKTTSWMRPRTYCLKYVEWRKGYKDSLPSSGARLHPHISQSRSR